MNDSSEDLSMAGPYSWSPDGMVLCWEASWNGEGGITQLTRLEAGGVEHGPLLNVPYGEWVANFSAAGE